MNALLLLLALNSQVNLRLDWEGGDKPASLAQEASVPGTDAGHLLSGAAVEPAAVPAAPVFDICPCLGYRGKAHCFCLQKGVGCKCNATTGSEWEMADSRPVRQTGKYGDPRKPRGSSRPDAELSAPGTTSGYEVTTVNNLPHWTDSTGRNWDTHDPLAENMTYGGRFQYRGGRMHEWKSSMSVVIPQAKGHYETRRVCHGSWCENVRVFVKD